MIIIPGTFGDSLIHQSHIDVMVECNDHKLHERNIGPMGDQEKKIGKIIADKLVDNGATLQVREGKITKYEARLKKVVVFF